MDKEYRDEYFPNEYDTVYFDNGYIKTSTSDEDRELTKEEQLDQTLQYYPDHWISEHRRILEIITNDIIDMAQVSTLGDRLEFSCVSDYLEYCNTTEIDSCVNWNDEEDLRFYVVPCPNKKNPSNIQFMRHFLIELADLYRYLVRNYDVYFGPFEKFCDFIYINSSSAIRIPED